MGYCAKGPFGCRKKSEEIESEKVNMESRGKLRNDGKVKFAGPRKSVRLREKTCEPQDICKLHKNLNFSYFLILIDHLFPKTIKQALSCER